MPTKTAMDKLSNINLSLYEVLKILEEGFELRKRKKNIFRQRKPKKQLVILEESQEHRVKESA